MVVREAQSVFDLIVSVGAMGAMGPLHPVQDVVP